MVVLVEWEFGILKDGEDLFNCRGAVHESLILYWVRLCRSPPVDCRPLCLLCSILVL